jgi:integrase
VLTDTFIRSAGPGIHWDGSLKGFGLRVGKNRKSFIVLVSSGRRKAIGVWPNQSLADARREARRLLAERKTLGRRHPTHTAFDDALKAYLAEAEPRLKPLTYGVYCRLLKRYRFGRQNIADITPQQILRQIDGLPKSHKRHCFAAGRTLFAWMERRHIIDRSPFVRLEIPPDNPSRSRVLSDDELRAIYGSARAGSTHFSRIVGLLVLSGQRPREIASLQWSWIKDDLIEFPAEVAKNGKAWTIPIGPVAANLLLEIPRLAGSPYVFPALRRAGPHTTIFNGWSKPKARFNKACGVEGWQLRDLRRTYSTIHAKLGTPQIVVEKLLNHVSGGTLSPIAAVYNVHRYEREMREAVLTFEHWLIKLPDGPRG